MPNYVINMVNKFSGFLLILRQGYTFTLDETVLRGDKFHFCEGYNNAVNVGRDYA